MKNVTYKNNSAGQYGNNIACFAQDIGIINQTEYEDNLNKLGISYDNLRLLESTETVTYLSTGNYSNQVSGGVIPTTYLAHIDKYGQIVGSDFSSKVRVTVNATYNLNPKANVYPPTIDGTSTFTS